MQALQDVSLRLQPGEVLAIVGENGAGKSTLMKIVAGVDKADAGSLLLDGQPYAPADVAAAQRLGVVLIHQPRHLASIHLKPLRALPEDVNVEVFAYDAEQDTPKP